MSWPSPWTPLPSYPDGMGQILGLVGCTAWSIHQLGQIIYTIWRHKQHLPSRSYIPPVDYALYRAWAGLVLGILNINQQMLGYNIALVAQPHIIALLGLVEWAMRHSMAGKPGKISFAVFELALMGGIEVAMLYVGSVAPPVLLWLAAPILIFLIAATMDLGARIVRREGADRATVSLMLIAVLGGSTSIVSVLYTGFDVVFGPATLALYGVDLVLWLAALLGAAYVRLNPKSADDGPAGLGAV